LKNGDRHLAAEPDLEAVAGSSEPVPNVPQRRFVPLVLEPRQKTFVRDGGHRVVDPQATLDRYGHHVSPITGAVSMLERISPPGDATMHVYLAGHNLARRHRSLGHLRGDMRNMSAGKGTTDVQARASGLCEGLERYSGVFRGDEPRVRGRLDEFEGAAIDVRRCLLFSERQYSERDKTNASHSMYNYVPRPFDPQAVIDWSPLWSLSRQALRYLPTAFCYYDFPHPEEHSFCVACSNGSAAGNTVEEAILQGFFELVERDSVALWWYNRVRRPDVNLASFEEPYLEQVARSLAEQKREMQVLDLTSDLGLPVFVAWSRLTGGTPEQIVLGFGAHLDARIALLRAVTEMNQMLSHLHFSPIDKIQGDVDDPETVHWLRTATRDNQPYLRPAENLPPRQAGDFGRIWTDDINEDVAICQRLVERQGLEMLVLDQTRPEIGLPVVKVVVPGLRHFWTRFAAGRLYDIPVRLGWRGTPLTEEELNPIPMFL
jgi:ribosomal protein S12 methylthiotransferase accessory factor